MAIEFLNSAGETVTALDLVTEITVSASQKIGVAGSYGSQDALQSMKATIPPGLPHYAIRAIEDDLYTECQKAVNERLAGLKVQPASVPEEPRGDLEEYFGPSRYTEPPEEPPQTTSQTAPKPADATPTSNGGRILKFAPKAPDRQPGDRWETIVTHYKLKGSEELQLWKANSRFPEAIVYKHNPAWPAEWVEKMPTDGEKHEFSKTIVVRQTVSEKKNDKGFYYVDITAIEAQAA